MSMDNRGENFQQIEPFIPQKAKTFRRLHSEMQMQIKVPRAEPFADCFHSQAINNPATASIVKKKPDEEGFPKVEFQEKAQFAKTLTTFGGTKSKFPYEKTKMVTNDDVHNCLMIRSAVMHYIKIKLVCK